MKQKTTMQSKDPGNQQQFSRRKWPFTVLPLIAVGIWFGVINPVSAAQWFQSAGTPFSETTAGEPGNPAVSQTELLKILGDVRGANDPLVIATAETLRHPFAAPVKNLMHCPLVVISYRQSAKAITDAVVQCFEPVAKSQPISASEVQYGDFIEPWLEVLNKAGVRSYGPVAQVHERDQLMESMRQGDLTELPRLAAEPLFFVALLPHPATFLPASFRNRVRGVVVELKLGHELWTAKVQLIAASPVAAQALAEQVSAWQEIVQSLALGSNADRESSSNKKRAEATAIDDITVEVKGNLVVARGETSPLAGYLGGRQLLTWLKDSQLK